MAGYVLVGTLAAFGLICAAWILWGWCMDSTGEGIAVLTGPLTGARLDTARRWIWLREMGLITTPMLAVRETLTGYETEWLQCHGFEICSREGITCRLGIEEKDID